MLIRLYSVRDKLLNVYLAPFAARADVEAIRQMKSTMADPQIKNASIGQNPKDFDLCYLATLDDETGRIFEDGGGLMAPVLVVNIGKMLEAQARHADELATSE